MSDRKDIKGKLSNVARKYEHLGICPREIKLMFENSILSEQPNQNCLTVRAIAFGIQVNISFLIP